MANYKVVDVEVLERDLTSVADKIRSKTGSVDNIEFPQGYQEQIDSIYWTNQQVLDLIQNRDKLSGLVLPEGITRIYDYLFKDASSLNLTELPDTIESLGYEAFRNSGIKLEKLPTNLKELGTGSLRATQITLTELPEGLEIIDNYAFMSVWYLKITSIPKSVKTIGQRVFESCPRLNTITFKGTPDSIGTGIFNLCTNLTVINVPWSEEDTVNVNAPWGAQNADINYNYTGE